MDKVVECKHGLRSGCAYCHARTEVAVLNRLGIRAVSQAERVSEYADKVRLAMDRRGPLAMRWSSDYRPIPRGVARFVTGFGGV